MNDVKSSRSRGPRSAGSSCYYLHLVLLQRICKTRHNLCAYHAAYIVLAEKLGAALITRDARLVAGLGRAAASSSSNPTNRITHLLILDVSARHNSHRGPRASLAFRIPSELKKGLQTHLLRWACESGKTIEWLWRKTRSSQNNPTVFCWLRTHANLGGSSKHESLLFPLHGRLPMPWAN